MNKLKSLWLMKPLCPFVPLLLCTFFIVSAQTTPNYTEDIFYNVDGSGNNIRSRTYSDGLGRSIQSQSLDNSYEASVVSGTEYDDAGRPVKSVKAFPYAGNTSLDFISGDLTDTANTYYGYLSGKDSAYSSIQYYNDPLGRVKATGSPGKSFTATAHPIKSWYFGVIGDGTPVRGHSFFDADGFIESSYLTDNYLDNDIQDSLRAAGYEYKYSLTVTKDPNGNFTQELKDLFGNTVRTWAKANTTDGPIISSYTHDILGQVLSEIPPTTPNKTNVAATTYNYNTAGQLVSKTTPDAGTTAYTYDAEGRLSTVTDARGTVLTYAYDSLGRNITISRDSGNTRIRNMYDNPEDTLSYLDSSAFTRGGVNLNNILDSLTNTEGRVVATIAYDEAYNAAIAESTYTGKVIDLYSYDDEGRVNRKYKSIPGLPLQTTAYAYDIHGKPLRDTIWSSASAGAAPTITSYTYDENGRLLTIARNGNTFIQYSYDYLGQLITKEFTDRRGFPYLVVYDYTIRGWVRFISRGYQFSDAFTENIDYEDAGTGNPDDNQYNGNISKDYFLIGEGNIYYYQTRNYTYDGADRLTHVENYGSEPAFYEYSASFSYLNDGRILQKHEGTTQAEWKDYNYYGATNRLRHIDSTSSKIQTHFRIYDPNGNMVLDRSKKMSIEYDWRNIPVKFRFFDTIPTSVNDWSGVQSLISTSGVKLQSEVVMTYDASGNRVNKEQFDYTQCTVGDPTDSSLVITDTVSKVSMFIDTNGSIKTCLAVTPFTPPLPAPDSIEGLKIENTTTHEVLFAITPSALLSGTITTTAYVDKGLKIEYKSTGGAVVIGADGGYVSVTGQIPRKIPNTGVAYIDGSEVFVWDLGTSSYQLSYVTVAGEGFSRADSSFVFFVFKDHLGSTRIVLNENRQAQEVMDYLAYGTEKYLQSVPADARAREKFTGKEFDSDVGIGLTYFGRRFYDPEIALWTSPDPKDQLFNVYGYGSNPISYVDPNGEWLGALIGALAGAYLGGAMSNMSFNPAKWDWESPGTYFGIAGGALTGWKIGKGFETALAEHKAPTGNKFIDDPDASKEMKSSLKDFKKTGVESGGAIDEVNGKYSIRKGEGIPNPTEGSSGQIEMPDPTPNTKATFHTQSGVELAQNYNDLNYNFPAYDKAAGSPLNHTILSENKIVNFTKGNYTMTPGTYGQWNTDYVFRSYMGRVFRHIFFAW